MYHFSPPYILGMKGAEDKAPGLKPIPLLLYFNQQRTPRPGSVLRNTGSFACLTHVHTSKRPILGGNKFQN
jgi:hypothetical protein